MKLLEWLQKKKRITTQKVPQYVNEVMFSKEGRMTRATTEVVFFGQNNF